jgi:putative heme-binding domain-containing protein
MSRLRSRCGLLAILFFAAWLPSAARAAAPDWITYEPKPGPGQGKHVVFLAGDEEYRSEEGLPMLAKILSQRHGFKCTVLFSVDAQGNIDPEAGGSLSNPAALDSADAIVMLLRFRHWDDATTKRFDAAVKRGVPIIALRTSTHAFNGYPKGSPWESWNFNKDGGWGEKVLGETWVTHWGKHKVEAARGVIEPSAKDHPLLRGVTDVFADSDVYEAYPPPDAKILLRGLVLTGMKPTDPPATHSKPRATDKQPQPVNSPAMPVAWTREVKNDAGKVNKVLCTTMGAATDLQSEGLRRLIVNGVYWGLGLDVPAKANVDYVDPYQPLFYGFKAHRRGIKASDHALGKVLPAGDPAPAAEPKKNDGKNKKKAEAKSASALAATAPALPPTSLPFQFTKGERVAFVGGSLAERMNLFGHFETLLHTRFPQLNLVIRNFGYPADEVGLQQRSDNYTLIDDPLVVFAPDTFFCFFGFNESFAGPAGVEAYKAAYNKWLDFTAAKFAKAGKAPRFVLISPIAFESTGNPLQPKGDTENANLKLYTTATREVATARKLAFVDVFAPTATLFARKAGAQFTVNGVHLNEEGDREVGLLLDKAMFGSSASEQPGSSNFERLRAAVNDKSWVHLQDYRMLNGWYVYGGRRTYDTETFPLEYKKIRNMAAVRDARVWDLAQGKPVPAQPDDSQTGELITPKTGFGRHFPRTEPPEPKYFTPEQEIAGMKVPAGMEVKLFASEREFPVLTKPNQLAFDAKGRLWVSCMPTYPQWKPGDPKPDDRLLIFEDTNSDGKADKVKVFYDKLVCPTGFEFWNGGVLVVDEPRLIYLKDTDGDDKADQVLHLLDGLATDDTHHTMGAFEWSHGGRLHMLEGVSLSTTLETPYGPLRKKSASGCYIWDPLTLKWHHFRTPGYGNPWCGVFDQWGNYIVGDGTNARQHDGTALSGADTPQRKTLEPIFDNEGMRPAVGNEFLISRHLPDDMQGQFIYACVINMNGMPRFTVTNSGGSFAGKRIADLLVSTNKAFRPVDPQIGPDGAIWFGDWSALLIGHMQYSQRDPLRDKKHGRIYRLVNTKKPLLDAKENIQAGKSITELLDQLKSYEPRTRNRARTELRDRPKRDVLAAVDKWVAKLDKNSPDYERLLCEALWTQEGQRAVDRALLVKLLNAQKFEARAAAVYVLANEWERIANPLELLRPRLTDSHPRVRLQAVRAASFINSPEGAQLALSAVQTPLDPWLDYTIEHALKAQESAWKPLKADAAFLGKLSPEATKYFETFVAAQGPGGAAIKILNDLANVELPAAKRKSLTTELAKMKSGGGSGALVYQRVCSACHQVKGQGVNFGPDLTFVGSRLTKEQIIHSILEPNAEIAQGFVTVNVELKDGDAFSGFVESESATELVLRIAGGQTAKIAKNTIASRDEVKASSMPEGLGFSIAPSEFLDLVDYLANLKDPAAAPAKKANTKKK